MTTALLFLVPLSLVLLGVAVWVFFWAADDGQFDDLDTPAWKIVLDDDSKPPNENDRRSVPMDATAAGTAPNSGRVQRDAPTLPQGSENE